MRYDCNYCTDDKLCYYHAKIEAGLMDTPAPIPEREHRVLEEWKKEQTGISNRRGWVDPRDAIVKKHMGTIKAVVTAMEQDPNSEDWNDLFGAAMFGAASAIDTWKPELGASLQTYLRKCCRNSMFDFLRKKRRWERELPMSSFYEEGAHAGVEASAEDEVFSYTHEDSPDALWQEASPTPEEEFIRNEELAIAFDRVKNIVADLTEREQYVLFNHILDDDPESLDSIADRYETSKTSIFRDKARLLKHLELKEVA